MAKKYTHGSEVEAVIQLFKERDKEAEKQAAADERLNKAREQFWELSKNELKKKYLKEFRDEVDRTTLERSLPEKMFEWIKDLEGIYNPYSKIKEAETFTNFFLEAYTPIQNDNTIKTPIDGLEFYSLDARSKFIAEIKASRIKDLENFSGGQKEVKLLEYKEFDDLMELELNRYNELNKALEEYNETRRIEITNLEYFRKMFTGHSPTDDIRALRQKEEKINYDYNNWRKLIKKEPVSESWKDKYKNNIKVQEALSSDEYIYNGGELKEVIIEGDRKNISQAGKQTKSTNAFRQNGEWRSPEELFLQNSTGQLREALKNNNINKAKKDDHEKLKKLTKEQRDEINKIIQRAAAGEFDDEETHLKALNELRKTEAENAKSIVEEKIENTIDKEGQMQAIAANEESELINAQGLESAGLIELCEFKKLEILKKYTEEKLKVQEKYADSGDQDAALEAEKLKGVIEKIDFKKPSEALKSLVNNALFSVAAKGFEKMGNSSDEAKDKAIALFNGIKDNASTVVSVVGDLQSTFGGLDSGLDAALSAVGNIASGFAKGGIAGGVMSLAGEGIKLFGISSKVNKEHEKALRLLEAQAKTQEYAYNLALLKKDLNYEEGTTIFGSDAYGKASNAANNYQKSINALKESTKELNNIDIVTGSRKSGWGFWKKQKDVYSDILSVYPDLIDANGMLNKELAQTVLAERKMSDESKAAVQNMIDHAEQVEAAYAEMKNYLTSIFGDLGNQMTDALVDAFKNGTDAMDGFNKSASSMLEKLVKDMVYSITLAPLIAKAQEEMLAISTNQDLTNEQKFDAYLHVLDRFLDDANEQQDVANALLGYAQKSAANKGIEIFKTDDTRTGATAPGLASMSQDSANELNGSFYAVRQSIGDIRNINNEALLVQKTMQGQLTRIADNTEYCRYLENVKNSLEDIQTRGIKVKV